MAGRYNGSRRSDNRNIACYIAFDNSFAVVQFGQELWTALGRIAENPKIGRVVPEFSALRVVRILRRFYRYLIFYRIAGRETIEVVRILHAARDITGCLRDFRRDIERLSVPLESWSRYDSASQSTAVVCHIETKFEPDGTGTLMTMRMTLPNAETRAAMLRPAWSTEWRRLTSGLRPWFRRSANRT